MTHFFDAPFAAVYDGHLAGHARRAAEAVDNGTLRLVEADATDFTIVFDVYSVTGLRKQNLSMVRDMEDLPLVTKITDALEESGFAEARPCRPDELSTPVPDPDGVPRLFFVAHAS
jgi:hypothetical protein